jgi:hypothetical protein
MRGFMKVDDILVSWAISTFDHQLKGPFPLPIRHYILDWTKASKNEQMEIMNILEISGTPPKQKSDEMWTESETFSVGAVKPDERMLRFRHMFVEKPVEEISKMANTIGKRYRVFKGVDLNREYFEDEAGREISMQEMIQIATGNNNVIPFDVKGIVRLGSCTMLMKDTWTVDKANILFNFMQVVRLIWRSNWARKRTSITTHRKDKTELLNCDFPTVENMSAILTLFRQLYASDKLMEKACKVYMEHSSNIVKKDWIDHCLNNFKRLIDGNPDFIRLQGCTVEKLFEAFLYGTGIVHSPSDRNRENRDRLSELVRQHGRENVIMALNASFWSVFKYAVDSFHVVKQDYERWTKLDGCVGSDMFDIYSLLQSHGSQ